MHGILAYEFELHQLKQLVCIGYAVKSSAKIFQRLIMVHRTESGKRISLASVVTLAFEKRLEEFRRVWNQDLRKVIYGGNGENGVLADVGMSMLQTGPGRRKEGLNQLGFSKLA